MRHRVRGRTLNRNASHRKAMFRNMAVSLLHTLRTEESEGKAKVSGRIVTTLEKAKELRPVIEKLITLAKKAQPHLEAAEQFATAAQRNTEAWKEWRKSERYQQWNKAIAPAVWLRRRAFSDLRDKEALNLLFSVVAPKMRDRNGGYVRIVRLSTVRLGDAGQQALIEFVGENDRVKTRRRAAPVVKEETVAAEASA